MSSRSRSPIDRVSRYQPDRLHRSWVILENRFRCLALSTTSPTPSIEYAPPGRTEVRTKIDPRAARALHLPRRVARAALVHQVLQSLPSARGAALGRCASERGPRLSLRAARVVHSRRLPSLASRTTRSALLPERAPGSRAQRRRSSAATGASRRPAKPAHNPAARLPPHPIPATPLRGFTAFGLSLACGLGVHVA